MPELNRRHFLQMASAASLVPAIPALPASAATAPSAMTSAQMLWAKLYANAGNAPNVTGLARAMGISSEAAQGVFAKLIRTQVLAAPGATGLSRAMNPVRTGLERPVATNAPHGSMRTRFAKVNDARKVIDPTEASEEEVSDWFVDDDETQDAPIVPEKGKACANEI